MGASLLALAKSIYIRFIAKRESRWSCDARVIQARFEARRDYKSRFARNFKIISNYSLKAR